jgi:anti-anti-sigma regulatory factor
VSAVVDTASAPLGVAPGSHVCWIVRDPATYVERAAVILGQAQEFDEKPVLFGPDGNHDREALAPLAAVVADPGRAFLEGERLDPEVIRRVFREQMAEARTEGYSGVRVVADMDWLCAAGPSTADIVGFELLLDRYVGELGATVVCAYREQSFDVEALAGALCVHPVGAGYGSPPPFRLVDAAEGWWRLSGEVDLADAAILDAGLSSAARAGPVRIDASTLEFADVAGLRAIASAARAADPVPIRIAGARAVVRRSWQLAGFADLAPQVEFVD